MSGASRPSSCAGPKAATGCTPSIPGFGVHAEGGDTPVAHRAQLLRRHAGHGVEMRQQCAAHRLVHRLRVTMRAAERLFQYLVDELPQTFIFDRGGRLRVVFKGGRPTDVEELQRTVVTLLSSSGGQ